MELSDTTKHQVFQAGYATKGILYLLIGLFAIATVIGAAKSTSGPKAIIDWLGDNPVGQVLTALTGAGLAAYALWRWYAAITDVDNVGHDMVGSIKRIGWAFSGTAYGLLAFYAFKNLSGDGNKGGKKDMVGLLLEQPYGQVMVGVVALIVAGVGVYQLYRGITDKHMEGIKDEHISEDRKTVFRITGRIGLTARCVVYGLISFFLFKVATLNDASQFRGIGDALSSLRGGDWGSALLAVTGAGMLAYGMFMLVRARYERL